MEKKSIMEIALESYPPHTKQRSTEHKAKSQAKEASATREKKLKSEPRPAKALKKYDMSSLLELYPPKIKEEEPVNLSRHQKVNHLKAERELDLHGMTWQEAEYSIDRFLERCQRGGIIAVRIIHGKGKRSQVEGGVLKQKVIPYLERDKRVKKVTQAGYHEGQSGACHVVLKLIHMP